MNSPVKGQSIGGPDNLTRVCKWIGASTNSWQKSVTDVTSSSPFCKNWQGPKKNYIVSWII